MAETKVISQDTNLKALALFTVAGQHYRKMREMEYALAELLGYEDETYCGYLSDEIYQDTGGDFAKGMKNEGFVVKQPKTKCPAR